MAVQVTDNGIGFEQTYADKVFELFEKLHAREQYDGLGAGLAICKKIVYILGGNIRAAGHPNQGATFTVYLPLI